MATTANITKVEIRYVPDAKVGEVFGKAMLGSADGFLPPEDMELQDMPGLDHSKRPANHPKNLETIYKHYQAIDGDEKERTTQLKVRSMSMGDCIVIDGKAYYVAAEGFVTVENGEVKPVSIEG
jgi:hypothetical protein